MKAKFPITDDDMQVLLHKYPFLRFHRLYVRKVDNLYHGKSKNIANNYWKIWDGTGWEKLWKQYLHHKFEEYDTWTKTEQKAFHFEQVKEKFGELRIYNNHETDTEQIAEWLSGFTCSKCGKQTVVDGKYRIWRTHGWIENYCEDCAKEVCEDHDDYTMKECPEFSYRRYSTDGDYTVTFKPTEDGQWLEKEL